MSDQTTNSGNTAAHTSGIFTEVTATASDPRNMRVTFDGEGHSQVEYLYTDHNEVSSTADVGSYPTGEQFEAELNHHKAEIANLQAKLAEQVFDRAGRATGFAVSGDRDRAVLQQRIATHQRTLEYTGHRLAEAHAIMEQKIALRAKAEADGSATEQTSLQAAAQREHSIATLAEQLVNGKPLGRQAAAEMIDRAVAEELARKLARGGR